MQENWPSVDAPLVDNAPILDIVFARWRLPCMSAALELGIFEALNEEALTAADLALRLGLDLRAVRAILPVLTGSGVLKSFQGRFALTAVARTFLLKDSRYFFGRSVKSQASSSREHARLLKALRPAPPKKWRWWFWKEPVDAWETGELTREMARDFAAYMDSDCLAPAAGAAQSGVFDGVRKMLDVGGGSGAMAIAVSREQPDTECTIMDLPAMCEEAKGYIEAAGCEDKISVTAVDMFREAWPTGYDGMVLSNIFHDWSFEKCAELASSAFEALSPGGRVFLHEMLLSDDYSGPTTAAGFSVQMLLDTRGQQFTFQELNDLLTEAGFTDIGLTRTYGYYYVVTGVKP